MSDICLIDFNDSLEVNRCSSPMDSSNSKKWKEELEEVADIVKLLEEETFDFDLPVSPESGPSNSTQVPKRADDEEEIFFGPVRYKEICVATNVNEEEKVAEKQKPLSPLTANEMAQLCQDAFTVACRIQLMTGNGDLATESTSGPVSSPPSSSPILTFSPLDEVFSNLSKILPADKRLSSDENGVVKFQGTQCKEPLSTTEAAEGKGLRQTVSRLGLNSHRQSRLARGSFRQRSSTLRRSGDLVCKPPQVPDSLFDNKCDGDQMAGRSPLMKQFCSAMQEAGEADDNPLGIASDAGDSNALNQSTGKRQLLAPKIKVGAASRLPHWSFSKPSQPGSTSSSAAQFTDSISGAADDSKQVSSGIQRSSSLHLGRPNFQLPRAETKVLSSDSITTESNPQSASKVMSSNLALIGTTAAQRKILTAVRSRPYGNGISQGPMKAVGSLKGMNTMDSAQDTNGFQMKGATSAGQATPKKTSGARASIGGTTPGSISRTQPVLGLPTPSKLKVPEISRKLSNPSSSASSLTRLPTMKPVMFGDK